MYEHDGLPDVSTVGTALIKDILSSGVSPSARSWDFLTLALAVNAADNVLERAPSPDGWTRQIELDVVLYEPEPYRALAKDIEQALRFLTGDFWRLTFTDGGYPPPRPKAPVRFDADCVCLLSGGLDSLVGALNLTEESRQPLLVSQTAKGDKETQSLFATGLGGNERHLQWNQNIRPKVEDIEGSTRGRSIGFFAFAAVAADHLAAVRSDLPSPIEVFVPENGLISLNVPLNPGRMGSLSTKTTHPVFTERLQKLWSALGIPAVLRLPYAAKTKGEMMADCLVPKVLAQVATQATSCGRFVRNGYKHCGRCVPCLVRRASFIRAGIADDTNYVFPVLKGAQLDNDPNDIGAVAAAVLKVEQNGVRAFTAGQLSFAEPGRRREFEGVVQRGLAELGVLLRRQKIL
ncbi:Qat anti-phage system QueC-like protein QatC [Achromobacter aegrifaciens]